MRHANTEPSTPADDGISIVVLTYGRAHLLRECVENVLGKTSTATREIVIWDNGSSDGTRDYLSSLSDPRLRVIRHHENIGLRAYIDAFALATSPYLVELDDDMVDAPQDWDLMLLNAFKQLPDVGLLAAGLIDNPRDPSAHAMYRIHEYSERTENGVRLLLGPTGGGCALTSREVYDIVGGFPSVFFGGDAHFVAAVERAGYRTATLADLKLLHAGGPHYSKAPAEKVEYWRRYYKRSMRKVAAKRALLAVPGVAKLNSRYRWFKPPEEMAAELDGARIWIDAGEDPAGSP